MFNSDAGKACNSIFISLTPDDKDSEDDEFYAVVVALLFRDELACEAGRNAIDRFGEKVQKIPDSVQGFNPVEVHALAESDATHSQA